MRVESTHEVRGLHKSSFSWPAQASVDIRLFYVIDFSAPTHHSPCSAPSPFPNAFAYIFDQVQDHTAVSRHGEVCYHVLRINAVQTSSWRKLMFDANDRSNPRYTQPKSISIDDPRPPNNSLSTLFFCAQHCHAMKLCSSADMVLMRVLLAHHWQPGAGSLSSTLLKCNERTTGLPEPEARRRG